MNTLTQSARPVNRSRSLAYRLALPFNADGRNALLRVTERSGVRKIREVVDDYWLSRIPADFGQGFYLEKVGPEAEESRYHVLLAEEGASCECRGYLAHDHCRHVEALLSLRAAGEL
jgi:hypothetical protein